MYLCGCPRGLAVEAAAPPDPQDLGICEVNLLILVFSKKGKGAGDVLKLGRSGRERARTEETE